MAGPTRSSASANDRSAVFAAQFALSHACWLVVYGVAGRLGAGAGMTVTLIALGALTAVAGLVAVLVWPKNDTDTLTHDHPELSKDHPHLREYGAHGSHAFVIDDLHPHWPHI